MSTRKQKLVIEKLEKKAFKTYNIKALWQCNHELSSNSKANSPTSELAKSSNSTLCKKINSTNLCSNIT